MNELDKTTKEVIKHLSECRNCKNRLRRIISCCYDYKMGGKGSLPQKEQAEVSK